MPIFSKTFLSIILILAFIMPSFVFAEPDLTLEREGLEAELKALEEQITQYEADISKTASEKKTLQNEIYILRRSISKLNTQIQQSNVMIKDIGYQIEDTEESITHTAVRIDDSKIQLANILQSIHEQDQKSILEILLMERELSGFFEDMAALEALNTKSSELLTDIQNLKVSLEGQKISLDDEKGELEQVVTLKTYQKRQSESAQRTQAGYLEITEAEYQEQLKIKNEAEKQAATIRTRIFELAGIPDAPTFGEALEMAKYVETVTGVRPAFLLALLTQESNIGKNVGQCYLRNQNTGAGIVIKSERSISKVMSPKRDISPFLSITEELGRDPYYTAISCPMSYGWGGAMGPAQFIPSTWISYRSRISNVLGRPADPWSIKDAFLASGIYLSDYGAAKQTYDGEFNAALSYFAGPGWYKSSYKNVYKRDYGYPIMSLAKKYESDIAQLE